MDEPFGALDPLTRDALSQDYRALHDKLGLTTVMITHDMMEALLLADRIAVMRGGRLVADGTPRRHDGAHTGRLCERTDADAAPAGGSPQRAEGAAMIENAQIADALARLPDYLGGHVLVSMTALALGLAVSFPLAILSMRRPTLRRILLTVASIAQTIPGLALLALFYPLLLALAALTERTVRLRLLRARLPALGAGARALQHAAGAAEHDHRP